MAENKCIGINNQMPWHISDDLKRFKALTMGHPVIMGRKTFESVLGYLNKPLPGRENIVISQSGYQTEHDVTVFSDLESAITHAKSIAKHDDLDEIFIIGGAQIYGQSLEHTDRIHMTKVHESLFGDAFFPEFNTLEWKETDHVEHLDHKPPYSFITLERV